MFSLLENSQLILYNISQKPIHGKNTELSYFHRQATENEVASDIMSATFVGQQRANCCTLSRRPTAQ